MAGDEDKPPRPANLGPWLSAANVRAVVVTLFALFVFDLLKASLVPSQHSDASPSRRLPAPASWATLPAVHWPFSIVPPATREGIPALLEALGLKTGAELGVQVNYRLPRLWVLQVLRTAG